MVDVTYCRDVVTSDKKGNRRGTRKEGPDPEKDGLELQVIYVPLGFRGAPSALSEGGRMRICAPSIQAGISFHNVGRRKRGQRGRRENLTLQPPHKVGFRIRWQRNLRAPDRIPRKMGNKVKLQRSVVKSSNWATKSKTLNGANNLSQKTQGNRVRKGRRAKCFKRSKFYWRDGNSKIDCVPVETYMVQGLGRDKVAFRRFDDES